MQIFLGACLFFIAVILLAYVPGKLLLILLTRTLSWVEDFTLACVLGLVVSALTYWLMALAQQAHIYVLGRWRLPDSFFISTPASGNPCSVRPRRSHRTTKKQ